MAGRSRQTSLQKVLVLCQDPSPGVSLSGLYSQGLGAGCILHRPLPHLSWHALWGGQVIAKVGSLCS